MKGSLSPDTIRAQKKASMFKVQVRVSFHCNWKPLLHSQARSTLKMTDSVESLFSFKIIPTNQKSRLLDLDAGSVFSVELEWEPVWLDGPLAPKTG